MQHFEENEIKIANYFDRKLSPAQEKSFMRELGDNAKLRELYEDELLMRGLFATEENELISDDDMLPSAQNNIGSSTVLLSEKKKQALLKLLFGNFRNIAAALLVFISIAIILVLVVTKRKSENTALKSGSKNITQKIDSTVNGLLPASEQNMVAENLLKNYYKTYSGKKDPVEISNYYLAYKKWRICQGDFGKR